MASFSEPASTCPTRENRARMPTEPPYPAPGSRTKPPSTGAYWKYELSRSFSKSSHQIHPGLGASHSAVSCRVGKTVMTAAPLFPSLVAMIRAVPAACPLTTPVADTVAISGFRLVHEMSRPVTGRPFASLGRAISCWLSPTRRLSAEGPTRTSATEALEGAGETPVGAQPAPETAPIVAATSKSKQARADLTW